MQLHCNTDPANPTYYASLPHEYITLIILVARNQLTRYKNHYIKCLCAGDVKVGFLVRTAYQLRCSIGGRRCTKQSARITKKDCLTCRKPVEAPVCESFRGELLIFKHWRQVYSKNNIFKINKKQILMCCGVDGFYTWMVE